MKLQAWTHQAKQQLEKVGISTAHLDIMVLAEDCLGKDRSALLAHPELELSEDQVKELSAWVKRRRNHEPLAYIRNKTEFFGRQFYIDERVLEPRPESETMIALLKELALPTGSVIADIGTGSGALAITTKLELPQAKVYAVDIDPGCLKVARKNAQRLNTDIHFMKGDLLQPLLTKETRPFALLANLPYVPNSFRINKAAGAEPRIAIFGGSDGLDVYRRLFQQLEESQVKPHFILTEALPPQHGDLANIARAAGFILEKTDDFIQLFVSV